MSNSTSLRSPGRAKRRKPLMVRSRRRLSLRMISSRRQALLEGGTLVDSNCTEPEIAAQVADLVRESGRQLTDRGHAVLDAHLLLEHQPAGDVLEDEDEAARGAVAMVQPADRETEMDLLRPAPDHGAIAAVSIGGHPRQEVPLLAIEQSDGPDRLSDHLDFADRQDGLSGGVDGHHPPVEIRGDEAAGKRAGDVAVEVLELRQILGLALELGLGAAGVLRHVGDQQRHRVEADQMDDQVVAEERRLLRRAVERVERSHLERHDQSGVEGPCQVGEDDRRPLRQQVAAAVITTR